MKIKQVTVPIPLTLMAPTSWTASWNEEEGAVYTELFQGEDVAELVERTIAVYQSFIGEGDSVEKIDSNGLLIRYAQADEALGAMCAEVLMQMEVRDLLAPGVYLKIIELLRQPRVMPLPHYSVH